MAQRYTQKKVGKYEAKKKERMAEEEMRGTRQAVIYREGMVGKGNSYSEQNNEVVRHNEEAGEVVKRWQVTEWQYGVVYVAMRERRKIAREEKAYRKERCERGGILYNGTARL